MNRFHQILVCMICAACTSWTTPTLTPDTGQIAAPSATAKAGDAISAAGQLMVVWSPKSGEVWLRSVDAGSGQETAGKTHIHLGDSENGPAVSSLSPDGNRLAVAYGKSRICEPYAGGSLCMGEHLTLSLVDVATWQSQEIELPGGGWASSMVFKPDSSQLALAYHQPDQDLLLLFDAASGALLASLELPFAVEWIEFVLGGSDLAVVGSDPGQLAGISQPEISQVLLIDPATLEQSWQHSLDGVLSGQWCLENCEGSPDEIRFAYYKPGISLSPDGSQLYIVHADEEKITRLDLKAHTSRTFQIQPQQSWLKWLLSLTAGRALAKTMPQGAIRLATSSPDGTVLYVATQRMSPDAQTPPETTLQAIDLASGNVISQAESRSLTWPTRLSLSPNGEQLLLIGYDEDSSRSEIYTPYLKQSGYLDGWQISPSRSPDGSPLLLGSDQGDKRTRLGLADGFFEIYHTWQTDGIAWWITPSKP